LAACHIDCHIDCHFEEVVGGIAGAEGLVEGLVVRIGVVQGRVSCNWVVEEEGEDKDTDAADNALAAARQYPAVLAGNTCPPHLHEADCKPLCTIPLTRCFVKLRPGGSCMSAAVCLLQSILPPKANTITLIEEEMKGSAREKSEVNLLPTKALPSSQASGLTCRLLVVVSK
jgi:hypothetical protein